MKRKISYHRKRRFSRNLQHLHILQTQAMNHLNVFSIIFIKRKKVFTLFIVSLSLFVKLAPIPAEMKQNKHISCITALCLFILLSFECEALWASIFSSSSSSPQFFSCRSSWICFMLYKCLYISFSVFHFKSVCAVLCVLYIHRPFRSPNPTKRDRATKEKSTLRSVVRQHFNGNGVSLTSSFVGSYFSSEN